MSPQLLFQRRSDATASTDPLFRAIDGANSPLADVSTVAARRQAYRLLLSKGLIRVRRPIPPNAEFWLVAVDDPYGHASARELSDAERAAIAGQELDVFTAQEFSNTALSLFAAGLAQVVDFYDQRFAMNLSASEKADLVAFLRTL